MNTKSFWTAVAAVFVVSMGYEFLVHGVILTNQFYKSMPALFLSMGGGGREIVWLQRSGIYLAGALFALFFTYIYTRNVEGRGWMGEGFRYGVLVWGLAFLPLDVGMYSWSAFPGRLLKWWIIYGFIECVILGWVCAAIYRAPAAAGQTRSAAA